MNQTNALRASNVTNCDWEILGGIKRFDSQKKVILFSVASLTNEVKLPVGKLEPAIHKSESGPVAEFTYNSGLPIPSSGPAPGVLVAVGNEEIEGQLVALLTVYSDRLWDLRADWIMQLMGTNEHSTSRLPRLTEGIELNCDQMALFFNRALSLSRDRYQAISAAAIALHQAIHASVISYDAAFAMAVFALESLVPPGEIGTNWSHFPEGTRQKLDSVLDGSQDIGDSVRAILLDDGNFKLQAKFLKFITECIDSDYFRSSAGVRRSDIRRLLQNAYSGRSGFVHALASLERPLGGWDARQMMIWKDREPHFTLQGIFFLAFEVIRNIIYMGPHLLNEEDIAWHKQLPGVVTLPLAHQYWLWRSDAFLGNDMRERFSDVLEYLSLVRIGATKELVDLRDGIGTAITRF